MYRRTSVPYCAAVMLAADCCSPSVLLIYLRYWQCAASPPTCWSSRPPSGNEQRAGGQPAGARRVDDHTGCTARPASTRCTSDSLVDNRGVHPSPPPPPPAAAHSQTGRLLPFDRNWRRVVNGKEE